MVRYNLLLFFLLLSATLLQAQPYKLTGRVTTDKLEPLAFASVHIKQLGQGVVTKEDGGYEFTLTEGKYDLVISMIGYTPQSLSLLITKDYIQNIILQEEGLSMDEVVVKAKARDRAEEIIRGVIRNKETLQDAAGQYSARVYIKAVQQDSFQVKNIKPKDRDTAFALNPNADLRGMAMAEILLKLDYASDLRLKEERLGVKRIGDPSRLFYQSATEGTFNFYNNLIKVPSLSAVPFVSPVSYSGLMAYKFKTLKIQRVGKYRIYTIQVKPRQLSNATVEGEITISDSSWAILHNRFQLPAYHLPEYDFFEVEQQHEFVDSTAWMVTRQKFTYYSKGGRHTLSGETLVSFTNFQLNKTFAKNHFGVEVSATALEAYKKDSAFWETVRTEPLTAKEIRFIQYKDSIYQATNTTQYLDSVDRATNRVTWQKITYQGQTFYNREKQRTWTLPPAVSIFQPFAFGGSRLRFYAFYNKVYPNKKVAHVYNNISYGFRNNDVNGTVRFTNLYNPFNRALWNVQLSRNFEHIAEGDAWINKIKRSNYYLNNSVRAGHRIELLNGLYLYVEGEIAMRRSVSNYKTNPKLDSAFGDILDNNQPVFFEPYNALYGKTELRYTPKQRYVREPYEKVILGSKYPTFFILWRKGLPKLANSKVDFDYLEAGIDQDVSVGVMGNLRYKVKTGAFFNQKDLRLVDYQFQRRGDPLLFMNPDEAFQSLDSTFPLFKRFYQGHFVHEFNGALLNRIPLFKKLGLREVAGAGFLIAPERNLRYAEGFAGIERAFKWPFNPLQKVKLGVYVVGSAANQFQNPVRFKLGFTVWDFQRNTWQ